jgi:hypothetical protein
MADASTEMASLSMLTSMPTLPNMALKDLALPAGSKLPDGFDAAKGIQSLGGMLSGTGAQPAADGTGALLNVPNTLSSRSAVRLVDLPGSAAKAVQSTSTLQVANATLLKGTPLEMTLRVVSQPTLRVTSTGDPATSKTDYTAPVIQVERHGQPLFTLDAANPTKDVPVGLPLQPLADAMRPFGQLASMPVVGGAAAMAGGALQQVSGKPGQVLDIGVLRLSISNLDEKSMDMSTPFRGFQKGASARLLDLQVLPTQALKGLLGEAGNQLPPSLAQLSLGEQVARAYAPLGGVRCGHSAAAPAPPAGGAQAPAGPVKELAQTSAAYRTVPMFWLGTGMLLLGVVLVAAVPQRRRE